jgi:hypothetical protein
LGVAIRAYESNVILELLKILYPKIFFLKAAVDESAVLKFAVFCFFKESKSLFSPAISETLREPVLFTPVFVVVVGRVIGVGSVKFAGIPCICERIQTP